MKLWFNGMIIDESEAVIPLTDHGFLYGMGLFETFRTYGGQPFQLSRHVKRLRESCGELRIPYTPDASEIGEAVAALLAVNRMEDAYVRWSVSAGTGPLGLPAAAGYRQPNAVIMVKPLAQGKAEPKELHVLALPRSTPEGRFRMKSFHYMNNVLAKWELFERTAAANAEGLFTDDAGFLVEGIVSNLFWVRDGVLTTPALETGCLPGVTRDVVLELAGELDISWAEGRFLWEELLEAEEVFVTNSVQELTPAAGLFDREGTLRQEWAKRPGEVTRALQQAYTAMTTRGNRNGNS